MSHKEPMLELFLFETNQLLEDLEQQVLSSEKDGYAKSINEIFRIMHTIKGSAAMMLLNNIAELAHAVEDLFFYLREEKPGEIDTSKISDLVLEGLDFIHNELRKVENDVPADGNAGKLIGRLKEYLQGLKEENPKMSGTESMAVESSQAKFYISSEISSPKIALPTFQAVITFAEDCDFLDLRAVAVVNNFKDIVSDITLLPEDFVDNAEKIRMIQEIGLCVRFKSGLSLLELQDRLMKNAFVREVKLEIVQPNEEVTPAIKPKNKQIILDDEEKENIVPVEKMNQKNEKNNPAQIKQSLISVNLGKLDILMDLVGEMVIAEAMVTRHPELDGLPLDGFYKAARQLRKLTNELQDVVMSIRMVPVAATFQKMQRIVRDMSRKLKKDVEIEIIGEDTEVDKNIIEHISDPLMHLIRNAIDHGIETGDERIGKGKSRAGKITLEAKSAGGDVLILIKDDGRGLNREKILAKAKKNGLISKPDHELTDKEIFAYILLPGFSTKEQVSEFSGRGVGMDVVMKGTEKVGGTVLIDSTVDAGTVITLKIPLTLAIIDGMIMKVGFSQYTVPTTSIRESFRLQSEAIIVDPDGNEMVLIRGECFPIVRLHKLFKVDTRITRIEEGVVMMVENNEKGLCLFADELLGEQQVVVKALPKYIKKVKGVAGCTLLGNGSISLILDVAALIQLI